MALQRDVADCVVGAQLLLPLRQRRRHPGAQRAPPEGVHHLRGAAQRHEGRFRHQEIRTGVLHLIIHLVVYFVSMILTY